MKYCKSAVFREIYICAINAICSANAIPKEPRNALIYFAPRASIAVFDQGRVEDVTRGEVLWIDIVFDGHLTAGYVAIIIGKCLQVGFKIGAIVGGRVKGIDAIRVFDCIEIECAVPTGGFVVGVFGRERDAHG